MFMRRFEVSRNALKNTSHVSEVSGPGPNDVRKVSADYINEADARAVADWLRDRDDGYPNWVLDRGRKRGLIA